MSKGMKASEIPLDIIMFYPEIDFTQWEGKKIKVWHSTRTEYGYEIQITTPFTFTQVKNALELMGFELSRLDLNLKSIKLYEANRNTLCTISPYPDYKFVVSGNGTNPKYFRRLDSIVRYFEIENF